MNRKTTRKINIGGVEIGGNAPISVQSMTNTKTENIADTVQQIKNLTVAGCDLVRVAIPNLAAAYAIEAIKAAISIPLIADIHFDYRLALASIKCGADALRLNPGNIDNKIQLKKIVKLAKQYNIPIRIGINAASLNKIRSKKNSLLSIPEIMIENTLNYVAILESMDFNDIKISLKSHDVLITIKAYSIISQILDYPLHVGITEAGTVKSGTVKSAVGIGSLLIQGIGDTIRVSLTGDPVQEVYVANDILKSLNLKKGPILISCPTCGRCNINLNVIVNKIEEYLQNIYQPIKIAIMGCIVNGPGEAKDADIGFAGGNNEGIIFKKGKIIKKVSEYEIINVLKKEIDVFLLNKN